MAGENISYDLVQAGYTLRLDLLDNATLCTGRYTPAKSGAGITEEGLREFLEIHAITEHLNDEGINLVVSAATDNKPVSGVVLALGEAMQPGIDGWFEMIVPDALVDENDEEENELRRYTRVNFKKIQTFQNVEADDPIGIIHECSDGVDGITVQSKPIPAIPGKPLIVRYGKGIFMGEDGKTLYANRSGRVFNSPEGLSVENVYVVKGKVDYHVGNIRYNGLVEVTGDVLDGFEIFATKGIKVSGIVGNALITSNGNIDINGMNGAGVGKISCGGDLALKYCNDTSITCAGNVTAQIEIRNSRVNCLGTLTVTKGAFCGGTCIALGGLEATIIGSKTSLPTAVIVGVNYNDYDMIEVLNHSLIELNEQFAAAPPNQRDLMAFMTERNRLSTQLQEVNSHTYENANPKVNVIKIVHENVRFKFDRMASVTTDVIKGPVTLISNLDESEILQLQMSGMPITADQLKEALLREQKEQKEVAGGE